jgi:hypothetical protein
MKSIINGKRYDTDKAILIGESDNLNRCSRNDFGFWEAGLYKTPRSGAYFLAGEGGPMTRWARPIGSNGMTGGDGIIPLTKEDALEWAGRHLGTKVVEKHFQDVIEDA